MRNKRTIGYGMGMGVIVFAAMLVCAFLIQLSPFGNGIVLAKSSEPSKTVGAPATTGSASSQPDTSGNQKMSTGKGPVKTLLPDLVVERVWLDEDCFLNFRIKNRGKGSIPDNQFLNSKVQVIHGKVKEKPYLLKKIDRSGRLKRPNGQLNHKTKIQLDKACTVSVAVDSGDAVKEISEKNTKRQTLSRCDARSAKKGQEETVKSRTAMPAIQATPGKSAEKKIAAPALPGAGSVAKTEGAVMKGPIGGITIQSPSLGDRFNTGDTITVRYRIAPSLSPVPKITFRMVSVDNLIDFPLSVQRSSGKGTSRSLSLSRSFTVTLPHGMILRNYQIVASATDPALLGKSEVFWIERMPDERLTVTVMEPRFQQRFPPGTEIPVRYSFNGGESPENVVIRIEKSTNPTGYGMELYSGPPRDSHLFPHPPASWPEADDYSIIVTGSDSGLGCSRPFSLRSYELTLVTPNGGETLYTAAPLWGFQWRADSGIDNMRVVLLKGGVEMYSWRPHVAPGFRFGDDITIAPTQDWHPAGTDYRIRIEGFIHDFDRGEDAVIQVASDESDADFEIVDNWMAPAPPSGCSERHPVGLMHPNRLPTGEGWQLGKTYPIVWCVHDESIANVRLTLVNQSSGELFGISMSAPNRYASTETTYGPGVHGGSLDWTVPETLPTGPYRVRVETIDGSSSDESDGQIYLRAWIDVTTPAGGEDWRVGETHTIEWDSGGLDGHTVDVRLTSDYGGHHYLHYYIGEGVPNSGSVSWTIEDTAIPEGMTERADFKIIIQIDRNIAWSDYFTIRR